MTILDRNKYSHITLRAKPGVYVGFPIVNNKGLFEHYFQSGKENGYILQTFSTDDGNQYGLYKNESGVSYLVDAFSTEQEICANSVEVIIRHFPHMLGILDIELKYDLHSNFERYPSFYYYELYARYKRHFILVSAIKDIDNLTPVETGNISKFPGAAEHLEKLIAHIAEKTAHALK